MNINEMIAKKESIVKKCDEELSRERNRTRPNVFLIKAREHDRRNALAMLKMLSERI